MSAHVASVVGIARAGSNKGQIGGAGALHAPERFERYIQEGLAWVPFYKGDTDIRGQRTQVRRRPLGRQGRNGGRYELVSRRQLAASQGTNAL